MAFFHTTTCFQVYLCVPSWPEITFLKLETRATSCPSRARSSAPVWLKCWSMRETTCAINAGTCSPCRLLLSSFTPSLHPPAAPTRKDVILSNSPACQEVTPLRLPARTTRRSKSKSRWDGVYSCTVTLEQPGAKERVQFGFLLPRWGLADDDYETLIVFHILCVLCIRHSSNGLGMMSKAETTYHGSET